MSRTGPWIAVDCGLFRNPKMRVVGPTARLLYIAGLLHCGDELTDGLVSVDALPQLYREAGGARRRNVDELVAAGLWEPVSDQREANEKPASSQRKGQAWRVRDYLEWNPSRSEWEARKRQNARRQAEWRERRNALQDEQSMPASGSRNALRNVADETRRYEVPKAHAPSRSTEQQPQKIDDELVAALARLQGPDGVPV